MRVDLSRKKSNPIWWIKYEWNQAFCGKNLSCLQEFLSSVSNALESLHKKHGVTFPKAPSVHGQIEFGDIELGKNRAGAIGLVVKDNVGFVTELTINKADDWNIGLNLPFNETYAINALSELLKHCEVGNFFPQLQAFEVCDNLGERAEGGSMDIACLMGMIDAFNHKSDPLLSFVCAVVQPDTSAALIPVEGVRQKLEAFKREYGSGSLLIRHPDSGDAQEFDELFDDVWLVSSYADLACHVTEAGLITALLEEHVITFESVEAIKRQVQFLRERGEDRLADAEQLIMRALACMREATPMRTRMAVVEIKEELHRHQGDYENAIGNAEEYLFNEKFEDAASYEDLIGRDYRLAASYYDAHRFDEIKHRLEPWMMEVKKDPRIISIESRPKLLNTYGRLLSALNETGWEETFRESISIQTSIKSPEVNRTRNYLIKAYLQNCDLEAAAKEIEIAESNRDVMDKNSKDHLDFYQADLHRRLLKPWIPSWFEDEAKVVEHARAYCIQAIARQPQNPACSSHLLNTAADSLAEPDDVSTNIRSFLAKCCRLAAAIYSSDEAETDNAISSMCSYLDKPAAKAIKAYYAEEVVKLKRQPSVGNAQLLFDKIPHF